MLGTFATVGVAKLKTDLVIDKVNHITVRPNGRPLPTLIERQIVVSGLHFINKSSAADDIRRMVIESTVRVIYRPRTRELAKWHVFYEEMLNVAYAVIDSWDRSSTLRQSIISAIPNEQKTNVSFVGPIMFTSMDQEPVERDAEFFFSDEDHAGEGLPAGYTLDINFSGFGIAKTIACL